MFANRFDMLMNIAKVTNSQMGHAVNLNSSYIGRLRSGARPLPKKHAYLPGICHYLAEHISNAVQIEVLFKTTGLQVGSSTTEDQLAAMLEHWLLDEEKETGAGAAAGRFISGFTQISSAPMHFPPIEGQEPPLAQYATHLFGNEGKRRAVEQFFHLILQEKEPQTLLLFSEENMEWMYEDRQFAKRWAELFLQVLGKGNRVRIIHTVNRGMNEILEAVMKWVPIYMSGAIEPYYYPRLRDNLFQHTLFIAPKTAAIVSLSVQQQTEGMLNEFITDKDAIAALVQQYERHFALCSPLMKVITQQNLDELFTHMKGIDALAGETTIRTALPPVFTLPKALIDELADDRLQCHWHASVEAFERYIAQNKLDLLIQSPSMVMQQGIPLLLGDSTLFGMPSVSLQPKQYHRALHYLQQLSEKYPNLQVRTQEESIGNTYLFVKESVGVMMAKTDTPVAAFLIYEQNMCYAFADYSRRAFEAGQPLTVIS